MATSTLSSWSTRLWWVRSADPSHQSGQRLRRSLRAYLRNTSRLRSGSRPREHRAQPLLDVIDSGWPMISGGRQLDDGSPRPSARPVQAGVEQRLGQEPAQQPLGLLVVERLAGRLVLDQLDPVEVALTADVADQWQVEQLARWPLKLGRALTCWLSPRGRRCPGWPWRPQAETGWPAKVKPWANILLAMPERLEQPVAGDHRADGGVGRRSSPWRR